MAVAVALVGCGGGGPKAAKTGTDGPRVKRPEGAGVGGCADVPVVGEDVEFKHVTYGEQVAIEGVPSVGPKTCTMRKCPSSEPCCNRCNAAYVVTIIGEERTATALQLAGLPGCKGSECGIDCDPFGREPAETYRFVGALVDQSSAVGAKYVFEVTSFCPLP